MIIIIITRGERLQEQILEDPGRFKCTQPDVSGVDTVAVTGLFMLPW
jgi:hypothetical protein